MPKSKHMLPFHDHPLYIFDDDQSWLCYICSTNEKRGLVYICMECELVTHKECVEPFLNNPFQCNHFLKFFTGSPFKSENQHCHFCRKNLSSLYARCTICNTSMDVDCLKNPPPLTIFQPKHHEHSLTLLSRLVTFTCNACGLEGDRNPYVCLACNMMLHKDCIDLPRVISINRHDHRISHTFHLGQGERDWECGVCRKTIDWVYGAYKCSRCPHYAVHSKCATRNEVWDGIELEDVPDEEEEIEDPYKVVNEKDIIHFSHENHILRLDESCVTDKRCEGCVLPFNGDPCYRCVECDFILHKTCASLPRKKRHLLHNHKLTLLVDEVTFQCRACKINSNGFRYKCEEGCKDKFVYDVRCSSVSEPFRHDLHPHPLYWTLEGSKECHACDTETKNPLCCTVCDDYALCMRCTTLPRKVKHRCDDHLLSLSQGVGNASGDLWCDVCECKVIASECYYTCQECGVSLDIDCVLGDFYYLKVGLIGPGLEVLANNGVTRPLCSGCEVRCKFPFLARDTTTQEPVCYFCNINCLHYH